MCLLIEKNWQRTEVLKDSCSIQTVDSAPSDADIQRVENFYPPQFGNPSSMSGNLTEDQ
jgi:hypothetical protein